MVADIFVMSCTHGIWHVCDVYIGMFQLRKVQLRQEVEKSRVLQDALHILAQEHHDLEQSLGGHSSPTMMFETDDSEDTDEFYDCDDESKYFLIIYYD